MTQTIGVRQLRTDQVRPNGDLWQRVRAWFDVPARVHPGPLEESREATHPVAVASQGDAFDFHVFPTFTWLSDGLTPEELDAWIERCTPGALRLLRRRAVGPARVHPPHYAHRLEEELNEDLGHRSWRFHQDEIDLTCRIRVRVEPDQRIRESMQPIWQKRIEMEAEHELGIRRADLVRERTEVWSSIMEKLQDNPLTAHAAALTENEFATVFREMVQTRKDASTMLVKILQEAVQGHNSIGLYEYAKSFDAALKAYQKQTGWADVENAGQGKGNGLGD